MLEFSRYECNNTTTCATAGTDTSERSRKTSRSPSCSSQPQRSLDLSKVSPEQLGGRTRGNPCVSHFSRTAIRFGVYTGASSYLQHLRKHGNPQSEGAWCDDMSTPPAPPAQPAPINVQNVGGAAVVPIQPQEMCYPLRHDTFELLCETETINEDKKNMELAIAVLIPAAVGVVSLFASVDWTVTPPKINWVAVIFTFLLCVVTAASAVVGIMQWVKVKNKPQSTGYWRAKAKIVKWYEDNHVS